MRIGLVKILPEKKALESNLQRLLETAARCGHQRLDVIVTPECFLDGYIAAGDDIDRRRLLEFSIDESWPPLRQLVDLARERQCWVILGCTFRLADGPRNSALIFDRTGRLVDRYDKVHCLQHDRKFVAGSRLPVFDGDFGRFGVMICADRRWPETVRTLSLKGAPIIFNPTYGMWGAVNEPLIRVRAYESECVICFAHPRESLIVGPGADGDGVGRVLARLKSNLDDMLVCDIDLEETHSHRNSDDSHLKHRVSSTYGL